MDSGSGRSIGEGIGYPLQSFLGFPGGSVVKKLPAMQETQVQSLDQEDPLEKELATHFSILAGKFHGQRRLAGCSPWGDMTE